MFLSYKIYSKSKIISEKLKTAEEKLEKYKPIEDIEMYIKKFRKEASNVENEHDQRKQFLKNEIKELKLTLEDYEYQLDVIEMNYYTPKYEFDSILDYSEALSLIVEAQKELIRKNKVILMDGSPCKTSKDKDLGKLAVNAFNGEAAKIIESVTYSNFERSKEKLTVSFEKANKLLHEHHIELNKKYLELKIKEMSIVFDFKEQEQKIKDEQADIKAQMREDEKARIEAEKAREKAILEQKRYEEALVKAREEMASKSEDEKEKYLKMIEDMQAKLDEATAERERATSMAQITRKGYVYIISNVGSFGDQVYKIGMTRRKDPMDRVKELGDASVPFSFDVHALVFSEDAPALESKLHSYFNDKRVNKVNHRKEFFNVTIDEIGQACKSMGFEVELTKLAEAREYKETLDISNVKVA